MNTDKSIVLSHYQNDIIKAVIEDTCSLIVQAVAGSGKTFTTVLACNYVPASASAIFVAFNKHIVDALRPKLPSHVEAKTCHSLGLRAVAQALRGRRTDMQNFKYHDLSDEIIKQRYGHLNWQKQREVKDQLVQLLNFARNTLTPTDPTSLANMVVQYGLDIKEDDLLQFVPGILEKGIEIFQQAGILDFTDMLWLVLALDLECKTYDYIFIDELQDLNALQHAVIKRSCHKTTRIIGVGDVCQSMYSFAGAMPDSMHRFQKDFNASPLPLSICYRCPKSHLKLARHVDNDRTEWRDDAPEGHLEFILQKDIDTKVQKGDLVLCRLTAPLISLCIKLIAKGVSAKVLGRNIGKSLTVIIGHVMDNNAEWKDFVPNLQSYENAQIEKLRKRKDGEYQIESLRDKIEALSACHKSPLFDTTSLDTFKRKLEALFSEDQTPITLCTVHRAKGLEADNVFLINDSGERDCMPLIYKNQQPHQLEQECNIVYVALTRAKKALYICSTTQKASERHKDFYINGGIRRFTGKKAKPNSVTENETRTLDVPKEPTQIPPSNQSGTGIGLTETPASRGEGERTHQKDSEKKVICPQEGPREIPAAIITPTSFVEAFKPKLKKKKKVIRQALGELID